MSAEAVQALLAIVAPIAVVLMLVVVDQIRARRR